MIKPSNIFEQPWWLDICAPRGWRKISIATDKGAVEFTYAFWERAFGLIVIYRPPLTPFLGISSEQNLHHLPVPEEHKLLVEVVPKIVEELPKYIRFHMNFSPSFSWWTPFYWEGFKQTTRYTYQLSLDSGVDQLWSALNSNAKRNIKKARKVISVTSGNRAGKLYDLFSKTMEAQGKKPGYPKSLLLELCKEVYERNAGVVLIGEDESGRAHAGLLLVWGNNEAYYLVGGTDPELRKSGAMTLLMWKAIEMAQGVASVFDFEGSMQKGIQRFIRNFNANPVPYHQISKSILTR